MPETCLDPTVRDIIDRVPNIEKFMHNDAFHEFLADFIEDTNEEDPFTAQTAVIKGNIKDHEYFHLTAKDELLEEGANVLVTINAHSNELVGQLTMEQFLTLIKEDPGLLAALGIKNLLIYDADPEGAAMNGDVLFEDTLDLSVYLSNFFRSIAQPDFRQPISYRDICYPPDKARPGVDGTAALLSEGKVDLFGPAHNAGIAPNMEAFWVATHATETFENNIPALAAHAELKCSEENYEQGDRELISKGVYTRPNFRDGYNKALATNNPIFAPPSSFDFLAAIGKGETTFAWATEPPLFSIDREKLPQDKEKLMTHLEALIGVGTEVFETIDGESLKGKAKLFYDTVAAPLGRWTGRVGRARSYPEQPLEENHLSFSDPFYLTGGVLGPLARLAELVGDEDGATKVKEAIEATVAYFGDSIEVVPLQRSVKVQLGTLALSCIAWKQGEIKPENYVHIRDPEKGVLKRFDPNEGKRTAPNA